MVAHFVVEQFELVLTLKLRLHHLDADDRGQPLAGIFAAEIGVVVLDKALFTRIIVDLPCDRSADTGEMAAAVGCVDRIGECVQRIGKAVRVLDRGLDIGRVDFLVDIDRLMETVTILVEIAYKRFDATLKVEGNLARLLTPARPQISDRRHG